MGHLGSVMGNDEQLSQELSMERGPFADWVSRLPTELLEAVSARLSGADLAAALAVSAAWKQAFGLAVQELRPTGRLLGSPIRLAQRFPELQRLCLGGCAGASIGDAQAREVGGLRRLTHLSMQGCMACTDAGLDRFSSLTGLQHLSLIHCKRLTGASLRHLAGMPRLTSLDLASNAWLRDADMASLCKLPSLQALCLAECKSLTSAGVGWISALPRLETLNLAGVNHLGDDGVAALSGTRHLQELVMDRCSLLMGDSLDRLAGLPLRVISMRECPLICDSSLACLSAVATLEQLSLDMCGRITDRGVRHLAALGALRRLSMQECPYVTGTGFAAFAACAHPLESLDLSDCIGFSQPGGEAVAALPKLAHLDLRGCERVDCATLGALARLNKLHTLRLAGCLDVTDEGLRHLARGCTSLARLDLTGCTSIRDQGVLALASLPSLHSILLNRCKHVSDAGVAALAVLVQLREVSLAGTMVSEQGLSLLEAQRRLRRAQCTPHYLRLAEAPAANLVGACA